MRNFTRLILSTTTVLAFGSVAMAHDNGYSHYHQNSNNDQLAGAAIGAVAGGVIGSQLAASGARTEGSVLGAVVGGVAGAAIAGSNSGQTRYHGQYNANTGYYSPPHQGYSYYSQPSYPTYYTQPSYYTQPTYYAHPNYYAQPVHVYAAPRYYQSRPYYPRSGVSISIGSNFGSSGYRRSHNYRHNRGRW